MCIVHCSFFILTYSWKVAGQVWDSSSTSIFLFDDLMIWLIIGCRWNGWVLQWTPIADELPFYHFYIHASSSPTNHVSQSSCICSYWCAKMVILSLVSFELCSLPFTGPSKVLPDDNWGFEACRQLAQFTPAKSPYNFISNWRNLKYTNNFVWWLLTSIAWSCTSKIVFGQLN